MPPLSAIRRYRIVGLLVRLPPGAALPVDLMGTPLLLPGGYSFYF